MIIGIDDTDSKEGMCTTYLAAVLIEELKKYGRMRDFPLLVRLNPNIRYKTRGNAAISISLDVEGDSQGVKETVISYVNKMSVLSEENTNPGVVFIEDEKRDMYESLRNFSLRAVREVLEIQEAKSLIKKYSLDSYGLKNQRGLIGALAAAGFSMVGLPEHTYELIAYREKKRWGSPRKINHETVWEADEETYPDTWDTVDKINMRVVFAPHTPDPVLFGIRGDRVESIKKAFALIESEPVDRHVIYRTNQGTDMHLMPAVGEMKEDSSYLVQGIVAEIPKTIAGGHVFFKISKNHQTIECAAFEPTKNFRDIIRKLRKGDSITAYGSLKNKTLNLEKINIDMLASWETRNPLCTCGKRMKSAGKGQGYRCKKCGAAKPGPELVPMIRDLEPGLYEVPPCARRHLSKPLVRFEGAKVHPSR